MMVLPPGFLFSLATILINSGGCDRCDRTLRGFVLLIFLFIGCSLLSRSFQEKAQS
jgi:hypothetical protein